MDTAPQQASIRIITLISMCSRSGLLKTPSILLPTLEYFMYLSYNFIQEKCNFIEYNFIQEKYLTPKWKNSLMHINDYELSRLASTHSLQASSSTKPCIFSIPGLRFTVNKIIINIAYPVGKWPGSLRALPFMCVNVLARVRAGIAAELCKALPVRVWIMSPN